jgi:hypothetical protein
MIQAVTSKLRSLITKEKTQKERRTTYKIKQGKKETHSQYKKENDTKQPNSKKSKSNNTPLTNTIRKTNFQRVITSKKQLKIITVHNKKPIEEPLTHVAT